MNTKFLRTCIAVLAICGGLRGALYIANLVSPAQEAKPAVLSLLPEPGSTRTVPVCNTPITSGEWARTVVHQGIPGTDGVFDNRERIPGDLLLLSPWEQSGDVTLSRVTMGPGARTAGNWTTITIDSEFPSVEGACWGDVDMDGEQDIVATSQTGDVAVYFAPTADADVMTPGAWTKMPITAVDGAGQEGWMVCVVGDMDGDGHNDIVLGGTTLIATGDLAYTKGPATGKRTDGNWPARTDIRTAGRVMSLHLRDVEATVANPAGDGDLDLIGSTRFAPNIGTWVEVNQGGDQAGTEGTFVRREISSSVASTTLIMLFDPFDINDDGDEDVCNGTTDSTAIRCHANLSIPPAVNGKWNFWTPTTIRYPSSFGVFNFISGADFNRDEYMDLVITASGATTGLSGVVVCPGPRYNVCGTVDGADGATSKYDNALRIDVDLDGWVDLIVGNQGDEDGSQEADEGIAVRWNPCPS